VAVPQIKTQINAKFIHGIYRDGDHLTVILDLKSILNLEEIKKLKT
jgi:chemotaxis signal transduction protein